MSRSTLMSLVTFFGRTSRGGLLRWNARLRRRTSASVLRTVVLPLYGRHDVDGVRVFVADPDADAEAVLSRVRESLLVLRNVDPRGFRQLRKYVRQIVVWPGNYTAFDRLDGLHLSIDCLSTAQPQEVAAVLLHETTHLRIAAVGIPYHPALRARIEAVCTSVEAAFLRRCGGEGPEWAAEVEAGMADPWWTAEERRRRVRSAFESVGIPGWLSRFFRWR